MSKFAHEFKVGDRFPDKFDEWLIEDLIPAFEFHLIGGPSGSGKSTLLFQILDAFVDGREIFGHKVNSVPCAYVSLDRGHVQTLRTMLQVGYKETKFPWWGLGGSRKRPKTLKAIMDLVKSRQPDVKFLVIEGLANMLDNGKHCEYQATGDFLNELAWLCHDQKITVLASVHSPKTKEKDRYTNPRERVLGSVNWAGTADTVIIVEPVSVESAEDHSRLIFLLPRNAAQQVPLYKFENGRLVPSEDASDATWRLLMDMELSQLPVGAQVTSDQIKEWADRLKLSTSSLTRWKNEKVKNSTLAHLQKGLFEVLPGRCMSNGVIN